MTLPPWLRKLALAAHVTSSVGWVGAIAAFLVLAIVGVWRGDHQLVRAAYITMDVIAWFVIVPLAFASLVTGIISSLGTAWGLFRYHWVLTKLLITALATAVLLVHMRPIAMLARAAARSDVLDSALHGPQTMMVAASGVAIVALIVATALSVYKPRGVTPYGARTQNESHRVVKP